MNNNADFNLIRESNKSDFYNKLLFEEYNELKKNNIFIDNHLHINISYLIENDYEYEFGVYITNNSNNEILIKEIPIIIKNNNNLLKERVLSLNKNLKSFEATFVEIKFDKNDFDEDFNIDLVNIEFGNINEFIRNNYIKIDFDGIDKIRDKAGYSEIKRFLKDLTFMKENELAIDIFRVGEIEDGFYIIALFRNSSNREINIKSIPITVENNINLLIYKGVFEVNDDSLTIKGISGKLKVIVIPRTEFPFIDGEVIEEYNVKIE